jgi:hypothetical protein
MDGSTEDSSIAKLVIAGLQNGLLWVAEAAPVWVGPGLNKPCIVCRRRITHYELQYDVPGPRGALPTHATCHSVWREISDGVRNNPRT